MNQPAEFREAEATIKSGSTSFALASKLFDPETRLRVWLLYAWCRHCDDVIDGQAFGRDHLAVEDAAARLRELRERSTQALDDPTFSDGPFAGLARVVSETGLPRQYVLDHLTGYEMDVAGYRTETLADTVSYCYHVAGVVGLMMAWIMGVRHHETLLRGCDLGIAFQLTNIARDINDDAVNGRVYLPGEWLRESHVTITLGQPLDAAARRAVLPVVSRLLTEADRYYASAWYGIAHLPPRSAWAVATARHVYADIGREVQRRGARAWDSRVATTRHRKVLRLTQAMVESAWAIATRWRPAPRRDRLYAPPSDRMLR